jgi:hypothetical protein
VPGAGNDTAKNPEWPQIARKQVYRAKQQKTPRKMGGRNAPISGRERRHDRPRARPGRG